MYVLLSLSFTKAEKERGLVFLGPEAEFKEFEPRLKYGWFHTKNCIIFFKIYAGAHLKLVLRGFETRLKFIKFGHRFNKFEN